MDKANSVFEKMKMIPNKEFHDSFEDLQRTVLPDILYAIYGSDLYLINSSEKNENPNIYGSLVMSQEGYYAVPSGGSGLISGHNHADAFMLTLLHVPADAVMLGAETLRKESHFQWHYSYVLDFFLQENQALMLKKIFDEFRQSLNKPLEFTPTIFISNSGSHINLQSPIFLDKKTPTYIATGERGYEQICKEQGELIQKVIPIDEHKVALKIGDQSSTFLLTFGKDELDLVSLTNYLKENLAIHFLLYEGGQRGLNALVQKKLVSQFFLTHMSFSPHVSHEELKNASYLFTEGTHMIPDAVKMIDSRKDEQREATFYNLDFRSLTHL